MPAAGSQPPSTPRAIEVLNTPLRITTYAGLTSHCHELARRVAVTVVDFTNTQIVTMRRHEPEFCAITERVDYFVPDGMPLIWCLNAKGADLRDRVYGPTFMRHCVMNSPAPLTHYLLGGSEECLARLKVALEKGQPGLKIVGSQHGYFSASEEGRIVEEINRLSPDFIWVGLGTPRQQAWIHRHRNAIKRGVIFAVGFAFDVNAGTKKDAPLWAQRLGLTWVFRLSSEPRRLASRYFKFNTLFLYYLLRDALFPRKS